MTPSILTFSMAILFSKVAAVSFFSRMLMERFFHRGVNVLHKGFLRRQAPCTCGCFDVRLSQRPYRLSAYVFELLAFLTQLVGEFLLLLAFLKQFFGELLLSLLTVA